MNARISITSALALIAVAVAAFGFALSGASHRCDRTSSLAQPHALSGVYRLRGDGNHYSIDISMNDLIGGAFRVRPNFCDE